MMSKNPSNFKIVIFYDSIYPYLALQVNYKSIGMHIMA